MAGLSIDDALGLWVPSHETISPRGDLAAWVERPLAEDQAEARVVVCAVADGEPEVVNVRRPGALRWASSGRALALTSRDTGGRSQLSVITMDDRRVRSIATTDGAFTDVRWRPAHHTITSVELDVPEVPVNGGPPLRGELTGAFPRPAPRGRLVEIDRETGRRARLLPWDGHVWGYAFSPDGDRVAYIRSAGLEWQDISTSLAQLVIHDVRAGGDTPVPADVRVTTLTATTLTWSPDGRRLACVGGDGDDWPGGNTYFVLDAATGDVLTRFVDEDTTIVGLQWFADDDIAVTRIEGTHSAIYVTRADLTEPRLLTPGPAGGGAFNYELAAWPPQPLRYTLSADAQHLCSIWTSGTNPPEVWGGRVSALRRLSAMNAALADRRYSRASVIAWDSDGLTIEGLFVPPLDAGKGPWPTFVQLHGGPAEAWEDRFYGNWNMWAQVLAARGIATFMPNPRGSIGRGAGFQNIHGRWALDDTQDIMRGIDHAVAAELIDADLVCIGGWSYGGLAAAALLADSDRFVAAIIGAGFANLASEHLTSDAPLYVGPPMVGTGFAVDPDHYWARSPIRRMRSVSTPTLIFHSELDVRVPVTEGRAIYRALSDAGAPVELVIFPGEGHALVTRACQQECLDRGIGFLERHLLGR